MHKVGRDVTSEATVVARLLPETTISSGLYVFPEPCGRFFALLIVTADRTKFEKKRNWGRSYIDLFTFNFSSTGTYLLYERLRILYTLLFEVMGCEFIACK